MHPPVVRFLTKIIHPNVSRHGDVGIDIIQHNWSLALTISKLLLSVQSLLTDPFTEVSISKNVSKFDSMMKDFFNTGMKFFPMKMSFFSSFLIILSFFSQICMEPELGRLYEHDRPRFEALARRFTWKYAMFEVIP